MHFSKDVCRKKWNLKCLIYFSWQPESKFPFAQVRLPPKDGPKQEFQENQEIEVYTRANEQEGWGWWKAIIKV